MRVCMLAEKLPPEFTGSGKQAVFLGKALVGKGLGTIGLCSNPSCKPVVDETWGFPIVRLQTSSRGWLRSFEFALKSTLWLLKNRREYDILHVHGYSWGGLTCSVVAKLLGKKAVYKITLPGEDDPEALFKSRVGRVKIFLLNQFDAFVSISHRVQKHIEDFRQMHPKLFAIPNGVDDRFSYSDATNVEARSRLVDRYHLNEDVRIISYMGSIEYRKGIDVLAKAWPSIITRIPESRLLLAGPFSEQTRFHQQLLTILGEHLGKTVFLVGNVPDPELYYQASDVFVFPSRNESFGNVLLEAMACGRACVATLIHGVTESIIVDGHNGIVVNQEDHKALADAVINILKDYRLKCQLGENAVKTVRERYCMDTIADKYCVLYQSLVSGKLGNAPLHLHEG